MKLGCPWTNTSLVTFQAARRWNHRLTEAVTGGIQSIYSTQIKLSPKPWAGMSQPICPVSALVPAALIPGDQAVLVFLLSAVPSKAPTATPPPHLPIAPDLHFPLVTKLTLTLAQYLNPPTPLTFSSILISAPYSHGHSLKFVNPSQLPFLSLDFQYPTS